MKLSKGRTASNQILPDDKEAKNLNYLLFTFIPGSEAHPPRSHPLLTREKKKKYTQLVVVQWMYWRGLCKR